MSSSRTTTTTTTTTVIVRGGVVRYERGGNYWLELWHHKELGGGIVPVTPPWLDDAAVNRVFLLIQAWPARVEQMGAFVEHVVRIDARQRFVALLAYRPRSPLELDFVAACCRRLARAPASDLKILRQQLPDELAGTSELRTALDRHRSLLASRTLDFLELNLGLARLPQVIYALSALFPTRALLSPLLRRRTLALLARSQPLTLCFEWRRRVALLDAAVALHVLPLWGLAELLHWYDVMVWTRAHWSALEPACLHATNGAYETVRTLSGDAAAPRRAELAAAINLVHGLSRLWLATGVLTHTIEETPEWRDATAASRRLALSCGGLQAPSGSSSSIQVPSQQLLAATLAQQLERHFSGSELHVSTHRRHHQGQLELYVAQFPDYAIALRAVLARRASYGRCLLVATTECGRLELTRHTLQPVLLSSLPAAAAAGSEVTDAYASVATCVVDQAHRLTLEQATSLLALLLSSEQRTYALDLFLVGDPEAPSNANGALLTTLWRQQRFRCVHWLEAELLVEPMFEGVRQRAAAMCSVRTALREDATLHADVRRYFVGGSSETELTRALDRLLVGLTTSQVQIYCRRSEEAQLLSRALAATRGAAVERGRLRAGERVIVHDRGAVGILSASFELGRHVHVAAQPTPTPQLWTWMPTHAFTMGLIVEATTTTTTTTLSSEELAHSDCCAMPRLGRATNHELDSALVLVLRECPQVRVPVVVCFVGETTTRDDVLTCAARCSERLFILTWNEATLAAALQRRSVATTVSPALSAFIDVAFAHASRQAL